MYGILQARKLEWLAIPFSRGSSPRDRTLISCIVGRFFLPSEPPGMPLHTFTLWGRKILGKQMNAFLFFSSYHLAFLLRSVFMSWPRSLAHLSGFSGHSVPSWWKFPYFLNVIKDILGIPCGSDCKAKDILYPRVFMVHFSLNSSGPQI